MQIDVLDTTSLLQSLLIMVISKHSTQRGHQNIAMPVLCLCFCGSANIPCIMVGLQDFSTSGLFLLYGGMKLMRVTSFIRIQLKSFPLNSVDFEFLYFPGLATLGLILSCDAATVPRQTLDHQGKQPALHMHCVTELQSLVVQVDSVHFLTQNILNLMMILLGPISIVSQGASVAIESNSHLQ